MVKISEVSNLESFCILSCNVLSVHKCLNVCSYSIVHCQFLWSNHNKKVKVSSFDVTGWKKLIGRYKAKTMWRECKCVQNVYNYFWKCSQNAENMICFSRNDSFVMIILSLVQHTYCAQELLRHVLWLSSCNFSYSSLYHKRST